MRFTCKRRVCIQSRFLQRRVNFLNFQRKSVESDSAQGCEVRFLVEKT